ncbi:MAG: SIS domain-containing protein [Anaerorhabdus sp.]|uniref:SIS domain-containing protein n=1 Tax=Anaerorhabdus sp. TaxID=1872524 RepID=UPI003A8BFC79
MDLKDCIKRIPSLLEKKINKFEQTKEQIKQYIVNKKIDEIVVIASGTSLNSAKVTKYFAKTACGLKVTCIYPNEFLHYYTMMNENALYIAISQGGSTKLVYDSLEFIKSKGLLNCSITEDIHSPIAKLADIAIEMGSEKEEYMYRTIGYSTTVATCCLIEIVIAYNNGTITEKTVQELIQDMLLANSNLNTISKITDEWYKKHKFALMKRNKCILAGPSYLYETANEADIKIMEMVPMVTRSFELEELIHGPQNAFDDDTIFFLLCDKEIDLEKTIAIKKFINNEIGFCSIVGSYHVDEIDLTFDYVSKNFRMLESITAFQVIAYHLATDHGRDLSRGVNACIANYIKKTL